MSILQIITDKSTSHPENFIDGKWNLAKDSNIQNRVTTADASMLQPATSSMAPMRAVVQQSCNITNHSLSFDEYRTPVPIASSTPVPSTVDQFPPVAMTSFLTDPGKDSNTLYEKRLVILAKRYFLIYSYL